MYAKDCRYFSGYKPCVRSKDCSPSCLDYSPPSHRILIVHLQASGAVLRATSLLSSIRKKYPKAHITWLTKAPSHLLLKENPYIDQIYTLSFESLLKLEGIKFNVGYFVDKDQILSGISRRLNIEKKLGFLADERGSIVPLNPQAQELWELGLNNNKKFFENQKSEIQLMCEALDLEYLKNQYILNLTGAEELEVQKRRSVWSSHGKKWIIGFNTGCSPMIPYRQMSIAGFRRLIQKVQSEFADSVQCVLLGGPDETLKNQELAKNSGLVLTPTEAGVRDGLTSVKACDIVVSGDSLGMHMGIAFKKWVVAWFGPTCHQEIELYNRGVKILTQSACSPCWKRKCNQNIMCYDNLNLQEFISGIEKGIQWNKKFSLSKPHFLETSSSVSL